MDDAAVVEGANKTTLKLRTRPWRSSLVAVASAASPLWHAHLVRVRVRGRGWGRGGGRGRGRGRARGRGRVRAAHRTARGMST